MRRIVHGRIAGWRRCQGHPQAGTVFWSHVTLIQVDWLRGQEGRGAFSVQLHVGNPSGYRSETSDAMFDMERVC